jgi:hypothetical protein
MMEEESSAAQEGQGSLPYMTQQLPAGRHFTARQTGHHKKKKNYYK